MPAPSLGARIAPGGAAVGEPAKDLEPLADDVVGRGRRRVGDEAEAACVVLEGRIVQTLC